MLRKNYVLETVNPDFGSSFTLKKFDKKTKNKEPYWHAHPEMELIYVKGGNGKRLIGKHQSNFVDGDLVFIGENLPHLGFTDRLTGNESETVIQFSRDFLGSRFFDSPELMSIRDMFERSRMGILFSKEIKEKLGPQIENLVFLNPFQRMIEFVRILKELSSSSAYTLLNLEDHSVGLTLKENKRIQSIYKIIHRDYARQMTMNDFAASVNMTPPSFSRFFKKESGKPFTKYVNEFRIAQACKLLSESVESVANIAEQCGFTNYSHFSKQFVRITGKTPTDYRKDFRQLIK